MRDNKKTLFSILTLCLFGCMFPVLIRQNNEGAPDLGQVLGVFQSTPENFWESIAKAGGLKKTFPEGELTGGILPHDVLHSEYAAHFFRELKKQNPPTILLIAPNHQETGIFDMTTAKFAMATDFGRLETDNITINKLANSSLVGEDEAVIANEHAFGVISPYIKYYLPQTKIIPLAFKAVIKLNMLERLKELLTEALPSDTFILATVDFSHYLPAPEAARNDEVTAAAIKTFDHIKLLSFGNRFNDYLDSPPSAAFILMWFKEKNHKVDILYQTNSGLLSGSLSEPCTSYFEAVFYDDL